MNVRHILRSAVTPCAGKFSGGESKVSQLLKVGSGD